MGNDQLKNLDSEKALLQKRISEIEFQRQEILRSQKPKSNSERWEELKKKAGYGIEPRYV